MFDNQKILITGGTGSLGISLTKRLLQENVDSIRIFSRNENNQILMSRLFPNEDRLRFHIGDIRDKERLLRSMEGVDVVIHTAALKHVDIVEYNPFESVKTNVIGTQNVIDACHDLRIKIAVGISTDKAVAPLNVYGATKLLTEKLFVSASNYVDQIQHPTNFVAIRYGNVLGSSGSVVPRFIELIRSKNEIETTWKYNFYKITISKWLYNKVFLVNGVKDLINIPIGISHSIFYKKENIKNDKNIISMMYNKGKYKGSSDGINALIEVKNKLPSAKFILFGKDKRPKNIPKFFVYKRNVSESELVEIYNRTGIFVSSSFAEGFGLPAAEAMACGCAIVTTDCGGNREYAINNKTALVSKPSYSKELSKNIIELYENDPLRNKLINNGKNLIKSFNWENAGFLFENFINKK